MKPMNADNKAYKMSVVQPSPDYVNRIAHYLPYRTTALESLNHQLFPEESKSHAEAVNSHGLLEHITASRGQSINSFTNKAATGQQSCDLSFMI